MHGLRKVRMLLSILIHVGSSVAAKTLYMSMHMSVCAYCVRTSLLSSIDPLSEPILEISEHRVCGFQINSAKTE